MEKASFNNCVSSEEIYDIIDGEAAEKTCNDFYEHIKSCEKCRKEYESIKTLKTAMASCTSIPSADFAANTMKRLKKTERNPFIRVINTPSFKAISATAACLVLVFAILSSGVFQGFDPENTVIMGNDNNNEISVVSKDDYSLNSEGTERISDGNSAEENKGQNEASNSVQPYDVKPDDSEPRSVSPEVDEIQMTSEDYTDSYPQQNSPSNGNDDEYDSEVYPQTLSNGQIANPCTDDESNLITVSTQDAQIARKSFEFCIDNGIYQQLPYGDGYYFFNNEESGTQIICWIEDGTYYKISIPMNLCNNGAYIQKILSKI